MASITFQGMSKAERATLLSSIRNVRAFLGTVEIALGSDRMNFAEPDPARTPRLASVTEISKPPRTARKVRLGETGEALVALRAGEIDEYSTLKKFVTAQPEKSKRRVTDPDIEITLGPRDSDGYVVITYRLAQDVAASG